MSILPYKSKRTAREGRAAANVEDPADDTTTLGFTIKNIHGGSYTRTCLEDSLYGVLLSR